MLDDGHSPSIKIQCRVIKVTSKGLIMVPELINGNPHRFIPGPMLPKPAANMKIAHDVEDMKRQMRMNVVSNDVGLIGVLEKIEEDREITERTRKSRISDVYFTHIAKSCRFLLKDPEELIPFHSVSVLYELEVREVSDDPPITNGKKKLHIPVYTLENVLGYERETKITRLFLVRMLSITGEYISRRELLSSISSFDGLLYDEEQLKELLKKNYKEIVSHYNVLFSDHFVDEKSCMLIPLYPLNYLTSLTSQQKNLLKKIINDEALNNEIPSIVMNGSMWYKMYSIYVCFHLPGTKSKEKRLPLNGDEVNRIFRSFDCDVEDIIARKLFCKALWTLPNVTSLKRMAFYFAREEEEIKNQWIGVYEKWFALLKSDDISTEISDHYCDDNRGNVTERPPHVFTIIKSQNNLVLNGHIAVRYQLGKILQNHERLLKSCIVLEGIDHELKNINAMIDSMNEDDRLNEKNTKDLWSGGVLCVSTSFNESTHISKLTGLKSFPFWTLIDVWNSDNHGNPSHFEKGLKCHTFIIFGWTRWKMIHLLHLIKVFLYYDTLKNVWFVDPDEWKYSENGLEDRIGDLELNRKYLRKHCDGYFDVAEKFAVPSLNTGLFGYHPDIYHEDTSVFPEKLTSLLRYHFNEGERTMADFGIYCVGEKRINVVRNVLNSVFSELCYKNKRNRYIQMRGKKYPFGGNFILVGDRVMAPFSRDIGYVEAIYNQKGDSLESSQVAWKKSIEKRFSSCGRFCYDYYHDVHDNNHLENRVITTEQKIYIRTNVEPFEDHSECCGTKKKYTRVFGRHLARYIPADVISLPSLYDEDSDSYIEIPEANINILFCGQDVTSSSLKSMIERKTKSILFIFQENDMNGESKQKKIK